MERVSFFPWTFILNPGCMTAQVIHAARHPRADPIKLKYSILLFSLGFITYNGTLTYIFPFILRYFFSAKDVPEALSVLTQSILSTLYLSEKELL